MTLASAPALPSMTALAPPPASAVGPASPPADDGGFARALQQARQGRRDGASNDKPPATPSKSRASAQDTKDTNDAEGSASPEAAGETEERLRAPGDPGTTAGHEARRVEKTPAEAKALEDGSLPPWMTANLPPAATAALTEAGGHMLPGDGEAAEATLARASGPAPVGAEPADDRSRSTGLEAARRSGSDDRATADDTDGDRGDEAGAAFRDSLVSASGTSSNPATTATPTALATGAVAAHGSSAGAAVPVAEHTLRAPLHSPAFAPALGAQLTLMVKEGVTEARLHLNPAEMGPISVQIQVEGGHARVEMAAEMAATRQILEQSMPALAGALRESGLTLTGGGVFEQSARQGQPGDAERRPGSQAGTGRHGTSDAGPAEPGGGARLVGQPRGVVDLYA